MSSLPKRPLGKNGPEIVRLGLGLMGLSSAYGKPRPDNERLAFLDKAYELGETFWDSSDLYGDNEDILGRWLKANPDKREHIFLATKFAFKVTSNGLEVDSSPAHVERAVASSLKRLGIDTIDLYYCHRLDGKTPVEKTVEAMAKLKAEGKIRHLGLSEVSAESLRRAHRVHPIAAVQMEYSPFALEIESEQYKLLDACRELGVAVVAYSPIGRGLFSGTIRSPDDFEEGDFRSISPRFSKENFFKNLKLVEEIQAFAKKKGVTTAQYTLAWLLAQGDDIFPIPGTTKEERLVENLDSLKITLTKEEEQQMRKACNEAEIVGARYPAALTSALFADTPRL